MLTIVFTAIGTGLSLVGITCGAVAFSKTYAQHRGDLLPGFSARLRAWRRRLRALLSRTPPQTIYGTGTATGGGVAVSGRGFVTGPDIPADAGLEMQVEMLIRRVETIERAAAGDRKHTAEEIAKVRGHTELVASRMENSVSAMKETTESMVLDTIKLQLVGLLLVGFGTVFLSLGTFVAS